MLSGKLALVTGGGSGIGRAVCLLMAREGAKVVVSDYDFKTAEKTVSLLTGEEHMPLQLDVSNPTQVGQAVPTILARYSAPPTVLVNSAGITRDAFLLKMSLDQFTQVLDVNVTGTYTMTQAVCQALVAAKSGGSVVNIASVVGQTGNMGQCNYAASKAAVEAFTKTVAKEMGTYGIRCNAVVPGFIQTPMTEKIPDKVKNMFTAQVPLGRMGTPEEVAEVIVFLASDRSSYVNGASFNVTGGL
ncbi:estradiol 17-beta-dehydrogenase 8-like isoform X1 [Homalodisca vitripennis]|uniref:estradiol 17-beta-dehydrogenase 8-like isoform X1 n=2 Tax=Homalodisca vitripennis TaxID=197043 RepID=UPI001EE9CAD4|nr:estradiol 17-beta-dehydrogenase 8-like isoform X1 [Homalodisca vitripennis]